jgi:hypothetical protein
MTRALFDFGSLIFGLAGAIDLYRLGLREMGFLMISNIVFIVSLMILGMWLETINGKNGLFDELLTPWPLGIGGGVYLVFERALG